MALTHKPAHMINYPDRFEDDETGWGYSVRQDIDATDPRSDVGAEHAALWAFNEPHLSRSVVANKPQGNLGIDAFEQFYEVFDAATAFKATVRWLDVFHPESTIQLEMKTIVGYSQGDWLDVIAAVEEGQGTAEALIEKVRMWAFGDVWTVIPDKGSGISGIYADSAEAAMEQFRKDFEDEPVGDEPSVEDGWDNELPKAIAECLADREEPEAARAAAWLKEHESDDQVWSAINRLFDDLQELAAA